MTLSPRVSPVPPRVTITEEEMNRPIQLEEGQPLSLTCEIESDPEATVVWFNGSEPFISETDDVKVSKSSTMIC